MTDVIRQDSHNPENSTPIEGDLADIDQLLNLAQEINATIISMNEKKRRMSMSIYCILFSLFALVFEIFYLYIEDEAFFFAIKPHYLSSPVFGFVLLGISTAIFFFLVFKVERFERFKNEINVEVNLLGELIDILNSLIENLDFSSAKNVPIMLVEMKVRRLSFSLEINGKGRLINNL